MEWNPGATIQFDQFLRRRSDAGEIRVWTARRATDTSRSRRLRNGALEQAQVVKRIGRAQVAAAEVHVAVAVELIGSGFGHSVDDQSASLAIFRVVIIGEDLKFLDLVHGGTQPVASGNQLVSNVCSINVVKVGAIVDGTGTNQIAREGAGVQLNAGSRERQ